jgi:hypothetical protein
LPVPSPRRCAASCCRSPPGSPVDDRGSVSGSTRLAVGEQPAATTFTRLYIPPGRSAEPGDTPGHTDSRAARAVATVARHARVPSPSKRPARSRPRHGPHPYQRLHDVRCRAGRFGDAESRQDQLHAPGRDPPCRGDHLPSAQLDRVGDQRSARKHVISGAMTDGRRTRGGPGGRSGTPPAPR